MNGGFVAGGVYFYSNYVHACLTILWDLVVILGSPTWNIHIDRTLEGIAG